MLRSCAEYKRVESQSISRERQFGRRGREWPSTPKLSTVNIFLERTTQALDAGQVILGLASRHLLKLVRRQPLLHERVGRLHLDTLSLGTRLVSLHVEEGWDLHRACITPLEPNPCPTLAGPLMSSIFSSLFPRCCSVDVVSPATVALFVDP